MALLELLKQKKKELYPRNQRKEKNNIFSKVEEVNNRKIYHTKIFNDFYTFGISKNEPTKFFISLRGIFNIEDLSMFHLFSFSGDDIFFGIYYVIQQLVTAFLVRNFIIRESSTLRNCAYLVFRFMNGGVFCYFCGLLT
ncbi:DUF226 domain-containing protein, partial [Pseudomonas aeruginosa]|nr:DUF226 domain-containing protein [Pseudomonas aeruginosa]